MVTSQQGIRRGLPRRPGGEPWPPVGIASAPRAAVPSATPADAASVAAAPPAGRAAPAVPGPASATVASETVASETAVGATAVEEVTLRRGLPRVAGGEPWPPSTTATVQRAVAAAPEPLTPAVERPTPAAEPPTPAIEPAMPAPAYAVELGSTPTTPERETRAAGTTRNLGSRVRGAVWGVLGVVAAAGIIVLAARGVTTLPGVPEFLQRYPGAYAPPDDAPVGFPVWLNWMHYLNFFFMVLIVRTGLQVRHQQQPPAYWTPKKGGKKVSINLWLHTGIDLLWLLNGAAFVVLLFATGQWMRIVPTSWEVFPNALSAGLQYLTLDWPTEHGWVYYNSLQQLAYFAVVFVAAPLAAITGVRMSEWWPQNAERLNRIYPAQLARAIHYPTMLFFVLFVIVHVFLVLTTGALRNLNHMFAASDAVSWAGFAWFAAGLVVAVAAVVAARPLVIAPIASLFGRVSSR